MTREGAVLFVVLLLLLAWRMDGPAIKRVARRWFGS